MNDTQKKYRLLIVEDNKDLNDMFQIAFDEDLYEIASALNGIEGISKAVEYKPDLILLDIMMPQMDGYEFLKAIRNNTSLKPIIVINSNLEQKKDMERATTMGANYYLNKSDYTPFELVAKIQSIIDAEK